MVLLPLVLQTPNQPDIQELKYRLHYGCFVLFWGFLYVKSLVRELRGKKQSLKRASVVQLRGMMRTGT